MAKQNLQQLIEWLSRNDLNRFEIYDVDKEKSIEKCVSYDDLTANFENPTAYFVQLAEKGIKTIQIFKKIKNGSSFRKEGCGLNFAISNDNVAASGAPESPAATPQQPIYGNASVGLAGSASGLSMPEIMTMRSQADRYQEAKSIADEFKAKYEALEAENKRLERDNLKLQLGNEGKPTAVDKLVEGIAANPAALSQIIESFKPNRGLNSPQPATAPQQPQIAHNNLSDTKTMVVEMIANNKQLNDEHVSGAYYVLREALKGNQNFIDAYIELLKQHEIIENNGSDDHSNG